MIDLITKCVSKILYGRDDSITTVVSRHIPAQVDMIGGIVFFANTKPVETHRVEIDWRDIKPLGYK